jgi:predicted enzyme related to lactoylglutathione lyase
MKKEVCNLTRVVHFEIISDNPKRTKEFYEEVFDWKVQKWDGPIEYWFLMTGSEDFPGIDGAFGLRQSPDDTVVNTIDVDDLDRYIQLVIENGGEVTRPKTAVPGVGWLAYFKDTEGNIWGMMQDDPSAGK